MKKIFIFAIAFYFWVLFQTSFLSHFSPFWSQKLVYGFTFGFFFILNFFEDSKSNFGLFSALIGGFLLDVFSSEPIGFHLLILMSVAILTKFVFKKYVRTPVIKKRA